MQGKHKVVVILSLLIFCGMGAAQKSHLVCLPSHPWEGQNYFQSRGCNQCHAVYGKGGDEAPDLGENKFYGTYFELAAMFWNHFPKMYEKMEDSDYAYKKMTPEEMKALVGYLSFIRYMGEDGNAAIGRKLLHSKNCFECHTFGGEGGSIGPDISAKKEFITPIFLATTMWNHGPAMMDLFTDNDIDRPEFSGNDILHLAYGIQSFMRPTKVSPQSQNMGDPMNGEKLAKTKGCMLCHSFHGEGGDIGPDFHDVDLNLSVTEIAGRMWNHGPRMWELMKENNIPIPEFKDNEMADVIAYVYALKLMDDAGDKTKGEQLIRQRNCLSCHALDGQGADVSVDLASINNINSPFSIITAMWNHAPAMRKKHVAMDKEWPEFTSRDIANIYAYLNANNELTKK